VTNRSDDRASLSTVLDDTELMAAVATSSSVALEELYLRYSRVILSFATRMLGDRQSGEELLQEVFVRAWRQASSYSSGRGTVVTWLLSITHNLCIDELRKRGRRPVRASAPDPSLLMMNISSSEPSAHELAEVAELRKTVADAMSLLPSKQRTALELAYYNGLSQREIAEALGEPLGTIKTRMRLGLQKLRELLEEHVVNEL
jgi:RNA polymerase sigma-70 factor (ECF subfamily)